MHVNKRVACACLAVLSGLVAPCGAAKGGAVVVQGNVGELRVVVPNGTLANPLAALATVIFASNNAMSAPAAAAHYREAGQADEVFATRRDTGNQAQYFAGSPPSQSEETAWRRKVSGCGVRGAEVRADDWPYVMTIDDTDRFTNGPMSSSVSVHMVAVSERGARGPYHAEATSSTTNEMTSGPASFTAPSKTPIPPFTFTLKPTKLGSSGAMALEASGRMSITSTGVGTVTASGLTESTQLRNEATVPYAITVNGSNVVLMVDAGGQQLTFKGTVSQDRSPKAMARVFADKGHDTMCSDN